MVCDNEELVTVREAATMLRVSREYTHRLLRAGKLKANRTTPRKTLVTRASIEALIDESNRNI